MRKRKNYKPDGTPFDDDTAFGVKNALRRPLLNPTCYMCEVETKDGTREDVKRAIARYYSNDWVVTVCEEHDKVMVELLTKDGWTIDRHEEAPPHEQS
jgi:hypothetical protein